jgi:hypothetical protein
MGCGEGPPARGPPMLRSSATWSWASVLLFQLSFSSCHTLPSLNRPCGGRSSLRGRAGGGSGAGARGGAGMRALRRAGGPAGRGQWPWHRGGASGGRPRSDRRGQRGPGRRGAGGPGRPGRRMAAAGARGDHSPSVRRARPPVGVHSTVEQLPQRTTVWEWENTVVLRVRGIQGGVSSRRGRGARGRQRVRAAAPRAAAVAARRAARPIAGAWGAWGAAGAWRESPAPWAGLLTC